MPPPRLWPGLGVAARRLGIPAASGRPPRKRIPGKPSGLGRLPYRVWLEGRGICLQTVKHILSDARCLFRWAEDSDYVERSPFPRRLMPKIQERPPDRLTDDEVAKLVSLPDPHGFIIRLGLGTGLRWGEIARAKTSDIQDGMLVVSQTKSRKLRRVPLPPDLLEDLRNRVGLLSPIRHSVTFNQHVRRMSGVERFHVHQTRHTFDCVWLERGGVTRRSAGEPRSRVHRRDAALRTTGRSARQGGGREDCRSGVDDSRTICRRFREGRLRSS
jgi:integrase